VERHLLHYMDESMVESLLREEEEERGENTYSRLITLSPLFSLPVQVSSSALSFSRCTAPFQAVAASRSKMANASASRCCGGGRFPVRIV